MAKLQLRNATTCLLLCEGVDEKYFFIWFLDHYIRQGKTEFEQIQVEDFGGISQLTEQLAVWKNISGFDHITSLCIARDAESDYDGASRSVEESLKKNNFPVSDRSWTVKEQDDFRCAYILFPGLKDEQGNYINGTLEDLCLNSLKDPLQSEKLQAVDAFLEKCGMQFGEKYPRLHKNKLHSYLSIHNEFVGFKVGEAAKAGAFDFETKFMNEIKKIFEELTIE